MPHLAQHAMNVFQAMGLLGLQNFIRNARNAPYTDPVWAEGNTGIFLGDHSAIRHCRHHCAQRPDELPHLHFQWQEKDGSFQEAVLPATADFPANQKADDFLESTPLVNWPTTESIHSEMLRIAGQQAEVDVDAMAETPLGLAVIDTLAPDSRRAVNEEIAGDPQPSTIMSYLEALQRDYAKDAISRIPKPQWDSLVYYVRAHAEHFSSG